MKHRNHGLRKLCDCSRRNWPKCAHSWYFNFKPRGGRAYQFSLDVELGRHLTRKDVAQGEAERIRQEIRAGTFIRAADRAKQAETVKDHPRTETLDAFAQVYLERVSQVRARNKSWENDKHMWSQIGAFRLTDGSRLGDKVLSAITEDDLEAVMTDLRTKGRAASTRNGYVQLIKASFRWAAKKRHLAHSPIGDDSELIKRSKIAQRNRRLASAVLDKDDHIIEKSEEHRLLDAASPSLQRLMIAAIETACRRGELLSLTWADVDVKNRRLTIRAETAKDAEERVLPISARLAGVLDLAKTDPAGHDYKPTAFVFGELGLPVTDIKKAWETTVLKAHGHQPVWKKNGLAPESRAALRTINLHFHDLRHEAASRMLEAGWPLHHVQEMLGHASLDQTTTYLNVKIGGLQESMQKIDEARSRCNPVVTTTEREQPLVYNDDQPQGSKALVN